MREFGNTYWMGQILTFNYSGNNNPNGTLFASACLTNGCTYFKRKSMSGKAVYNINIGRDYLRLAAGGSFWCPFTFEQVIETLNDINEVVPIEFKVEETEECFRIQLEISNSLSYRIHFYVLTRVRYLYEFPQSALYYDAFRLKEKTEFLNWSLQNLYNLVITAIPIVHPVNEKNIPQGFNGRSLWYDNYHSIPLNVLKTVNNLLSNEELKEKVKHISFSSLNSIYSLENKSPVKLKYDSELFNSLSYWKEDIGFQIRLPYYLENSKLYTNNLKKAKEIELDNIEDVRKKLREIKIDLGYNQPDAIKKVSKQYSDWCNRIEKEKKEYKNPPKVFNRPRDARGRFIKIENHDNN